MSKKITFGNNVTVMIRFFDDETGKPEGSITRIGDGLYLVWFDSGLTAPLVFDKTATWTEVKASVRDHYTQENNQ